MIEEYLPGVEEKELDPEDDDYNDDPDSEDDDYSDFQDPDKEEE
jgi:hypothetical protein